MTASPARLDGVTGPAPDPDDGRTVAATAALTGVTVRTLHHWDAVGLVSPSGRTTRGYRLYSAAAVARIHRVLMYRELGLRLDRIAELLDGPAPDPAAPLREQREQLLARIDRLRGMVGAVDRLIEATEAGILLSAEQQVEVFGAGWRPERVAVARDRWGDTPQWRQFAERSAGRTGDDWRELADGATALYEELAAAQRAGVVPGSAAAGELAERHRASIGAYFDCTHAMHVCLVRQQAGDPEFVAYYDRFGPGLAAWLRDVVDANAAAHGVDPATATWT
ncbi:DNA-binding transcriptional regulator, MerR family [Jiangella alba]|uniref:DNA-binding transcriptional regulator, MerR family n=1 Tax=Jiangella alba TaxID=561176 RepID=A0A1H5MHW8_9ACTN|nr:DNA-binding transcriptional regulator, MerR family [Jiangella alba]